jgi:hypothetical protein
MTAPTEYRIEHVRDLLAVPEDKMDACLADLRLWVKHVRDIGWTAKLMFVFNEAFIWVDDGQTGCIGVEVTSVDAETGGEVGE